MLRKFRKTAHVLLLLLLLVYSVFLIANALKRSCFNKRWNKGLFTSNDINTNKTDVQAVTNSPISIHSSHNVWTKKLTLLGEPRQSKGFLSVGYLHAEPCSKWDGLERSIASLVSSTDEFSLELLSIIIVLRNCSAKYTSKFLTNVQLKYDHLLKRRVLKIVKPAAQQSYRLRNGLKSKYWEHITSYDIQYVRKAKLLVTDMAFLWKYSCNESRYFIQFTDRVIVQGNIVSHLSKYVKLLPNVWLWADNFRGFLTGRFYQTDAFPAMVEYMNLLGNQLPVNIMLNFYRHFRYSHPVVNISPPLPLRDDFYFTADNPPATIASSLIHAGGYSLQDIYNTKRGYFWAKTPQKEDYIIIELKYAAKIKRILIETGSHMDEDIIPRGLLSVVVYDQKRSKGSETHRKTLCSASNYTKLADFTAPSLDLYLKNMSVKCIKVVITPVTSRDLQFWVIFKTIAIFTDDSNKV